MIIKGYPNLGYFDIIQGSFQCIPNHMIRSIKIEKNMLKFAFLMY